MRRVSGASVSLESTNVSREASAKTSRAQVVAETRDAARLGRLSQGEAGTVDTTPEQARQIEQAGLRALAIEFASK